MAKTRKLYVVMNVKTNTELVKYISKSDAEALVAACCMTEGKNKEDYKIIEMV